MLLLRDWLVSMMGYARLFPEVIARCYELAAEKKAVIPVIDVVETVRHLKGEESVTVSRDEYKLVQTPRCLMPIY